MRSSLRLFLPAAAAASAGFVVHVATQPLVQSWVAERMQDRQVTPSWDVRYVALLTSLETGLGVVILYALIRDRLPITSVVGRGVLLALLLLAVKGALFRQPLMNLVIGNPALVVLVQDGITWLVWLSVCVVAAVVYEGLTKHAP